MRLGCTDERTAEITVLPTPVYALDLEFAEACSPYEATMPAMENAETTFWSFGDGTMSNEATPTHSWFNNSDVLAEPHDSISGSERIWMCKPSEHGH